MRITKRSIKEENINFMILWLINVGATSHKIEEEESESSFFLYYLLLGVLHGLFCVINFEGSRNVVLSSSGLVSYEQLSSIKITPAMNSVCKCCRA